MRLTAASLLVLLGLPFTSRAAGPDRFVQASGDVLRDGHGRGTVVVFRGVNLGGWLVMEGWQTPMDSSGLPDEWSVRKTLADRFGTAPADKLIDGYEDHWITDDDLKNIAAAGLNTVRVPYWYRTVESEDGVWRPDAFKHLDWIVEHATGHGLYVVLDLHGVPGGQSDSDSTGRSRKNKDAPRPDFFTNPANRRRATDIWKRVAGHFKGNPTVAAYDLLNEPTAAPTRDELWKTYDELYRAVRSTDPDHLITVEGCWGGQVKGKYMGWGLETLPPLEQFHWTNVLYQVHSYEWDWNNLDKQKRNTAGVVADAAAHKNWNVPVYVGEFNPMAQPDAWTDAIARYDAAGLGWTTWTYKATHGNKSDSWGLYNPKDPRPAVPNIKTDSVEEITAHWQAWTTESAFAPNLMLKPIIVGQKREFLIGGDVSALPDMEKAGATYRDADHVGDALTILHDHGMNAFRLRLFVDPDPAFTHTQGANQNLAAVLAMADRVKASGAKLIVDLHYSDTWADPKHQIKPRAWADLSGEALEKKVEAYTAGVMTSLKEHGTPPDFAQIGNEITDGMLFPDGKLGGKTKADEDRQWSEVGRLLSAGARGVRSVFGKDQTRVIVHVSSGGKAGVPTWFFDHVAEQNVDYDVIGLSFYPFWGDSMDGLKKNLAGLAGHGKQIMLLETAAPYRDRKTDANQTWPVTPDGQRQFLIDTIGAVKAAPGGIGIVWWYPEIQARPGLQIWEGATTSWFDRDGKLLPIGTASK